jgi:alpha-glucosidase (family GH31 glycosyl hydrolase)
MLHGINKNYILTIFNNNSSDQYVEIKTVKNNEKNILWFMEGGIIDLYLISDTNYNRNHKKIAELTGYSIMPPLWALGYHQCRWGYKDCNDAIEVEKKFNELNIPFDCFWFDIEHTDQKKYFTWDPKHFGNNKELLDKLNNENRYFVTIIDPHIKKDDNYFICNKLKEKDIFVKKNIELENYEGACWPGLSYYVDFLNYEKVLPIYKELFKNTEDYFYNFTNLGTWIDMNEPSVFTITKSDEGTMPKTNIHNDGTQLVEHREVHNIYGYFYQKVAYESLKNRLGDNKRAFILTRSFYAGSQKNGFIWTGDQSSSFECFNSSIETNIINSLCGISGTGSDVGGFINNPTPELMKVWYNLGNFYPFFRGHSSVGTIRREPWLFEKDICDSIIESIRLRYHLLMYVYTKFYEHTKNGTPILKPMWMKLGIISMILLIQKNKVHYSFSEMN